MDEKEIEKRMQDAWENPINESSGETKEALWADFSHQVFAPKKRNRKWMYSSVAALLILSLSIGTFTYINSLTMATPRAYTIIENPTQTIKVVTLPDGSVVELEPESTLHFAQNFVANRTIKLMGKAFFSVHKDKEHPFRVHCEQTTTTVLGTSFTVESPSKSDVRVQLYEGSIQMNVKDKDTNWILSPGEEFTYRNGKTSVGAFSRFKDFNDVPLSEVFAYIKNTYGYSIEIPAGYAGKRITLRLNKRDDPKNVIEIIAQMYELKPIFDEKVKKVTWQ